MFSCSIFQDLILNLFISLHNYEDDIKGFDYILLNSNFIVNGP